MTPADRALVTQLPENEVLALTAFLEARSEPIPGIIGVMWVVLNRVAKKHCGRTIPEVALWPRQFSCWNDSDPCQAIGLEWAKRLSEPAAPLVTQPDGIVLSTCLFLADRVLRDPPRQVPDPTKGALHYLNPDALPHLPKWVQGATQTVRIGRHVFYAGVA